MERKARILHVYKDIWPPVVGGIEKHIHDVCVGLRSEFDFTVMVACDRVSCHWAEVDGIPVFKVGTFGRFAAAPLCPMFPFRLRRLARDADIIHYHLPNPTGELSHLLARPRARAVATYHSDIVRQQWALAFYAPCLRAFLRRMDVILPTTERYIETSAFLAPLRDRCKAIPLGIDTAACRATPEIASAARRIRARYGNCPLIGFVGRLRAYKGLPYLIDALTDIQPHEAQVLIIGDGPMRAPIEALKKQRGVTGRVHLLGELSDSEVIAHLHAIDVFCLPSHLRSEAYGLAQIEAMACGKPVVSCNLDTGVPWVNQDGITGFVVAPMAPQALAQALTRLLMDPQLKQRMGEDARRRATQMFDRAIMLRKLARVYRDVAKSTMP